MIYQPLKPKISILNVMKWKIIDIFLQTAQTRKRLWTCSHKRQNSQDIQPIVSSHVESIVLLSKLHTNKHIEVELQMDEIDLTAAESKACVKKIDKVDV